VALNGRYKYVLAEAGGGLPQAMDFNRSAGKVHNPVFGNSKLGVLARLDHAVFRDAVRREYLHNQRRDAMEHVLAHLVVKGLRNEKNIRATAVISGYPERSIRANYPSEIMASNVVLQVTKQIKQQELVPESHRWLLPHTPLE
jgi:hypothetical protein